MELGILDAGPPQELCIISFREASAMRSALMYAGHGAPADHRKLPRGQRIYVLRVLQRGLGNWMKEYRPGMLRQAVLPNILPCASGFAANGSPSAVHPGRVHRLRRGTVK